MGSRSAPPAVCPEPFLTTKVQVKSEQQANGAGILRKMIDARFAECYDWEQCKSVGVDWIKRIRFNESILARLGVEIQVSGRSDLLARDIVHIRNQLQDTYIDVGVIVVPSDALARLLTDRVASCPTPAATNVGGKDQNGKRQPQS